MVATEPRPEVEEVLRYRARITVLVQRRKVIEVIVYTLELFPAFLYPQEVLRCRAWITVLGNREEWSLRSLCTLWTFPHFYPLKNFLLSCSDHGPGGHREEGVMVNIVYTQKFSRIFPPPEFSMTILGSLSWVGEERSLRSLCTLLNFPAFLSPQEFSAMFPDHCPVAEVLDGPYTAKPAQRSIASTSILLYFRTSKIYYLHSIPYSHKI